MDLLTAIKVWTAVKPIRRIRRWRNKRRARKGKPLIPEDSPVLDGKKTYLGIAITVIGLVMGWAGIGSAEDAEALVNAGANAWAAGVQLLGLILAAVGRMRVKKTNAI